MNRIAALILFAILTLEGAAPLNAQTEDWPRKVLLTNDDGIEAEGLLALARAFASVAETHVVAPLQNRSASTNYISAIARRQLEVETRSLYDGVWAYGVDGYPADAVVFALRGLLADDPPDLVISGVNDGPNLSDDWNLSGTVGAAQIAAFFGVPAIAVSGYSAGRPRSRDLEPELPGSGNSRSPGNGRLRLPAEPDRHRPHARRRARLPAARRAPGLGRRPACLAATRRPPLGPGHRPRRRPRRPGPKPQAPYLRKCRKQGGLLC